MLSALINTRDIYEQALVGNAEPSNSCVERLSNRDLELSGHVFVANSKHRRIQVTIDDVERPFAFIKVTGVCNEIELLQIIVHFSDLQVPACKRLFDQWILNELPYDEIKLIVEQFGSQR